jgi:hypothetical protein
MSDFMVRKNGDVKRTAWEEGYDDIEKISTSCREIWSKIAKTKTKTRE